MKYVILLLMLTGCTTSKDLSEANKTVQDLLVSSSKQNGCLSGVTEIRKFVQDTQKADLSKELRFHMVAFCLGLK